MAATKEVKETAVAVVPDRTKLTALVGTLGELIQAFDQIGANFAGLALNGWNTVQKAKAGCWLAHGAGMHPAVFMQNHYCMEIQNKLLVEPRWEFLVGVLQNRVPNFKFEVLEEANERAKIRMSGGGHEPQTVEYTVEDAKRQGLFGRGGNAWTAGNTREMCFKQAVKRCAKRLAPAALLDLPTADFEPDANVDGQPVRTTADVLEQAISGGRTEPKGEETPFEEVPAPADESAAKPPEENGERARTRLAALMKRYYGGQSRAVMAEKASFLYNAMMLERTGVDPKMAFKPGEIGPIEAEQMVEYLEARIKSGKEDAAAAAAPAEEEAPAPEMEVEPEPESPTSQPNPAVRTAANAYDELMTTVARARKLFGRKFVQEAPPGSSKFWFVDQATFSQAGDKASVYLQNGPKVVAPIDKLEALNRILAVMCDEKERGGR